MTVQELVRGLATVGDDSGKRSAQQGFRSLRVNGSRLMDSIHSTCEFGKAHPYGE